MRLGKSASTASLVLFLTPLLTIAQASRTEDLILTSLLRNPVFPSLASVGKLPLDGQYAYVPQQTRTETQAPAPTPDAGPTLGDLGFPTDQTQSNAKEQARLDKRAHMLKMHQRMGLITTVPFDGDAVFERRRGWQKH